MTQKGKIRVPARRGPSNGVTRRKFIQKLIKTGSAIILGICWLAEKAEQGSRFAGSQPRKFVQAIRFKKYPGSLKPGPDILKQSKWSG